MDEQDEQRDPDELDAALWAEFRWRRQRRRRRTRIGAVAALAAMTLGFSGLIVLDDIDPVEIEEPSPTLRGPACATTVPGNSAPVTIADDCLVAAPSTTAP